ncbi:hypothetical protein D0869_04975 [Hortaea werneckii]|uniref:YDG domain-containing protein n=1 Tax=Hortaea werneckii TaxID=91943 RepID=A0A3M6X068_HORWE|nr:hypothetical protein KC334_g10576 [Hortaea werneckii]KAI7004201.1 hypothetical protein KC355_g8813 [Hortaea werneckii]KAI7177080.1 hypothetical protein KC324_g9716 [Hortaea werneckii]KAI7586402.1 hypothetical protein KC316_g5620 [Hortaea werneckii]KAI7661503.1 hypothetical protein KC318_g9419 [Hortaea werneckii]
MPRSRMSFGEAAAFIDDNYKASIAILAKISSSLNSEPTRTGKSKKYYEQLDDFLSWLQNDVSMSPQLRKRSKIVLALEDIYAKPNYHFPDAYMKKARQLFERWEASGWKDEHEGDGTYDDQTLQQPSRRKSSLAAAHGASMPASTVSGQYDSRAIPAGTIRLPPVDHPIWGLNGIMHGVAPKYGQGGRKTYVLDPRYRKRDSRVIGSNNIKVGKWFLRQLVALFHGAHGHQQAGICGDEKSGAFSIVVSGQYELLDTDRGTYLYYSGSGSVDNTDPRQPAPSTTGTMALHTSLGNGNPVRVLRSSTGKSRYAPSFGMRYDGLYTVVSVSYPTNAKGGMYEQFKLERREGQIDIDMLVRSPSAVEIGQYQRINQVNTATWSRSSDDDPTLEE